MEQTSAQVINGKLLSQSLIEKIKGQTAVISAKQQRLPCLAVVLVGDDPASAIYVRNKKRACENVGFKSLAYNLPATTTQAELCVLIENLNHDNTVDGILVQLPLPKHIKSKVIIDLIAPNKDVDGFHRYNMGSLAINDPALRPCTPHGVIYMLDSIGVRYPGSHALVIGTSNIVGRPLALELINRGATVTICNSKTRDLAALVSLADIVIAAAGKPRLVAGNWLKPGAIAIDVGINRLPDGKLCGDFDFESALSRVSYISPVPGGVGPLTIAMLLCNTLECYKLNYTVKKKS